MPNTHSRHASFLPSVIAVAAGVLACAVIGLVWSFREGDAVTAEITKGIHHRIYTPVANADGQARLLASQADVREGITERNRIRLRGALRPALARMNVSYAGVLLPDGTPFFWLPDRDRAAIIARRQPIEYRRCRTTAVNGHDPAAGKTTGVQYVIEGH